MPRKKKKKKAQINIKSNETQIFFGIILFVSGVILLATPFTIQLQKLQTYFGYSSIIWGTTLVYISSFFLLKNKKYKSWKRVIGLILLSISISVLLSFWLAEEQIQDTIALQTAGGLIGKDIHTYLRNIAGSFIEILMVLLTILISFSLISNISLEQIRDFLEEGVEHNKENKINFMDILDRSEKKSLKNDDDIEISDSSISTEVLDEIDSGPEIKTNQEQYELAKLPEIQKETKKTVEAEEQNTPKYTNWVYPSIDVFQEPEKQQQDQKRYKSDAKVIESTLKEFNIECKVAKIEIGPSVVRYSISLPVGINVGKVRNLRDNIAISLKVRSVRIETPIPGTSYVGIEIPNPTPNYVFAKEVAKKIKKETDQYELPLMLGRDIAGCLVVKDLAEIPHALVAGATGTGKSVGLNSILAGLLLTKSPDEAKFILVDPKMVELSLFNGIPHLLNPVITDMDLVVNALQWTIDEMMKRYRQLKQVNAKKITEYNQKIGYNAMPYIIVVIDEMADLILTSGVEVETRIQRLAQMGRAVGIHLILATQKPTVNVITGLIKSNIPGRIAFATTTSSDSRVILDQVGAEELLGNGDMLFKDQTMPHAMRIQGAFTSTQGIENLIEAVKSQSTETETDIKITTAQKVEPSEMNMTDLFKDEPDLRKALEIVILEQKASSSFLQRKLSIGYNKAARIIDLLHEKGVIGPQKGSKPREVLVESIEEVLGQNDIQNTAQ